VKDALQLLGVLLGLFLLAALLTVGMTGVASYFSGRSCEATATAMGVPHRWSMFSECVVQVNGKWRPLNQRHQVEMEP
jgi:hypothetical protein